LSTLQEQDYATPPANNRNSAVSNGSVTIWEDAASGTTPPPPARRRKPSFPVLERIDSEGIEENMHASDNNHDNHHHHNDNVNRHSTIRAVPPSSSVATMADQGRSGSEDSIDEVVQRYTKNGSSVTTPPKNKTALFWGSGGGGGGGSTAPTPGSLYDRDGFLKE
jgi:hypothetical protein